MSNPRLHYSNTIVRFSLGEHERSAEIIETANAYHDAITSEKSKQIEPNTPHGVHRTNEGAAVLIASISPQLTIPTATSTAATDEGPTPIIATVSVGGAQGVGVNLSTNRVYVAKKADGTLSVIDGASNAVIATIPVGNVPVDVGVNSTTDRVYVANHTDGTVSVIDGATNTVIATVPVGSARSNIWVGVNPSTDRVYVTKFRDDTVYVIADTLITPTP